eukprot:jgi/Ulvmu1/8621/UM046_0021.1
MSATCRPASTPNVTVMTVSSAAPTTQVTPGPRTPLVSTAVMTVCMVRKHWATAVNGEVERVRGLRGPRDRLPEDDNHMRIGTGTRGHLD